MKRPSKRFGLRTLLIVVTIAAIVSAIYGNRLYRNHLQTVAVQAIKEVFGRVSRDQNKNVNRVMFRDTDFGDEELKEVLPHLKNLFALKEVDFVRNSLSDESVKSLQHLRRIEILYLYETPLTQDAIQMLDDLLPDQVVVTTEEPDPMASSMAGMVVYSHALVALDWTPNGEFLATGSGDGKIRLWDFSEREPVKEWKAHKDWAFAIAYSPDGTLIATGGGDNFIRLWDAETYELKDELVGHTDDVHSIQFSHDGTRIISSGDDKSIRIWNTSTNQQVDSLEGHTAQIPAITISDDGNLLASASRDNTVRLWDLQTKSLLETFSLDNEYDVNSVAFDSDSKRLAAGDQQGKVFIWNLDTREQIRTLAGHNGKVYKVVFDPSGEVLVSCGDDGIRAWDLNKGSNTSLGQTFVSNLAFNPTRPIFASTNVAGEIHLIHAVTGQTLKILRTMYGERGFDLDN